MRYTLTFSAVEDEWPAPPAAERDAAVAEYYATSSRSARRTSSRASVIL